MTKIAWNASGERLFETGTDRGVIYPLQGIGVPWNGITKITSNREGRKPEPKYIDGVKVDETAPLGDYTAVVSAFTYPDLLRELDGFKDQGNGLMVDNQIRERFNFTYRSRIGNDLQGSDFGYKIHFVYNALATAAAVAHETVNQDPDATPMDWDITTIPIEIPGFRPTAHFVVDSTRTDPYVLAELENLIYGSKTRDPTLPEPSELLEILSEWAELLVYDHGDGLFTARSTTGAIVILDDGTFTINSENAVQIDSDEYTLTSR